MKKANVLISIIAFFTIFFIFCGFAIDFTMTVALRSQLQTATEVAALSAAKATNKNEAETIANNLLKYYKINKQSSIKLETINFKQEKQALYIKTSTLAPTYFLSALGINLIEIQAQSATQILPIKLKANENINIENHIQYDSPVIIFDKTGPEIQVVQNEIASGYRIFTGLNNNENETQWVEITCSSLDTTNLSQYFDINDTCVQEKYNGSITAAKTIRIVNNNSSTPLNIQEVNLTNVAKLIPYSIFKTL